MIPQSREERYQSHSLVDIRPFKSLPFFAKSGVLLDLSFSGFKLDLTTQIRMKPGDRFWMIVPLSSLGIYAPKKLVIRAECRWYDPQKFRLGGLFIELSATERLILDQVINSLEEMRRNHPK